MKTHIAICKTYNGANKTIWLEDCESFWAAVEKARYLPQKKKPYPRFPDKEEMPPHLIIARLQDYTKRHHEVQWSNDLLIEDVIEIKEWNLG